MQNDKNAQRSSPLFYYSCIVNLFICSTIDTKIVQNAKVTLKL